MAVSTIEKNNKKIINGWAMFDWANSSYALVIAVAIFPIYFNQVIDDEFVLWGINFTNSSLFSFALSFAYLVIALVLPILSGIADYGGKRLYFMKFFTLLGSLACVTLYYFTGMATLMLGLAAFIIAVIGFAGGQVFYNSFLPIIATEDKYDVISAKGFAYGYIGSVLLLIFNLIVIQKPDWFGLADGTIATRWVFVTVGLWWFGFAQIPFRRLPKDKKTKMENKILSKGIAEIKIVLKEMRSLPNTRNFLGAYFFYMAGSQTVIYLASTFAIKELGFETQGLIILILVLQFVGIIGAYLFARISKTHGNKNSIMLMLYIWLIICVGGYFVGSSMWFYILASFVGLVMGGIQSLSRSTYSKLIPNRSEDPTSYFSFYDVLEKLAIVLGTFTFGLLDTLFNMRVSILALGVFFIISIFILRKVKI